MRISTTRQLTSSPPPLHSTNDKLRGDAILPAGWDCGEVRWVRGRVREIGQVMRVEKIDSKVKEVTILEN